MFRQTGYDGYVRFLGAMLAMFIHTVHCEAVSPAATQYFTDHDGHDVLIDICGILGRLYSYLIDYVAMSK